MVAVANIIFTQAPGGTRAAGEAVNDGTVGNLVTVTNSDDTENSSWSLEILDVPAGPEADSTSVVPIATFASGGAVPVSGTFTPDSFDSFLVRLTVLGTGGDTQVDESNFGCPNELGWLKPPHEATVENMNAAGQGRGWKQELDKIHADARSAATVADGDFDLTDNDATALRIHESTSDYLVFDTTNGAEQIVLSNATDDFPVRVNGAGGLELSDAAAFVSVGIEPSTIGAIRLSQGIGSGSIYARRGGVGNRRLIGLETSTIVNIADTFAAAVDILVGSSGFIRLNVGGGGVSEVEVSSALVSIGVQDLHFDDTVSFPTISQETDGNLGWHAAPASFQTMSRGDFVGNAVTAPTGDPAAGGFRFAVAGALRWRGSGSNTVKTIAPSGASTGSYDEGEIMATVQTVGTGNTNIDVFDNSGFPDSLIVVFAEFKGRRNDGSEGASYRRRATFRLNGSGDATQVGTTSSLDTDEDDAAWDVVIDIDGSGDIRLRVAGGAGDTVDWHVRYRVEIYTP